MRRPLAQPRLALVLIALLLTLRVWADVAPEPLATAPNPAVMNEAAARGISMKREEVTLELHDAYALVDATFVMSNPGLAQRLQVGFPGAGIPVGGVPGAEHRPLVGFSAWVSGKRVATAARDTPATSTKGLPGHEVQVTHPATWHVFDADFPAKGEVEIRVHYGVVAGPYFGSSSGAGEKVAESSVHYILSTGARWAGPIGEVVVHVRARDGVDPKTIRVRDLSMKPLPHAREDARAELALPAYGRREPDGVTLRRAQLKPTGTDNLEIVFVPDPARVPPRKSPFDLAPATALLRKVMGVDEPGAGRAP